MTELKNISNSNFKISINGLSINTHDLYIIKLIHIPTNNFKTTTVKQSFDSLPIRKIIKNLKKELIDSMRSNLKKMYPCDTCGTLRSEAEGGSIFTVCDSCWKKHYKKAERIYGIQK